MKSLRQATPPVSELSLDGLGINFEDDEWFLRRNVIDGIVENEGSISRASLMAGKCR